MKKDKSAQCLHECGDLTNVDQLTSMAVFFNNWTRLQCLGHCLRAATGE